VEIQAGTYRLGPSNGALSVRTERTGAAAKAGHNLLIGVTAWEATLDVGEDLADTSIRLDADATSLRVREGTGGMQALGDDDIASIEQTIDDDVLKRQNITFRSTHVQPAGDGEGLSVEGELTLYGTTRPIAFELAITEDRTLSAIAVVKQSDWGMKPYSALFGALKVVDEVLVGIEAVLPARRFQRAPGRTVS
jgi:polyisoprenoid-binding protein YceI